MTADDQAIEWGERQFAEQDHVGVQVYVADHPRDQDDAQAEQRGGDQSHGGVLTYAAGAVQ